jgi:hypothetical protein
MGKENFPDKEWLVVAVASLSRGRDEIFKLDYVPVGNHLRREEPKVLMVHNNDGLLNIPEALRAKYGKGRTLRMVTLTKEEKIQAQVMLS